MKFAYACIGKSHFVPFNLCLVLFLKLSFVVLALRSGLALKHSIDVGVGVIDANYRGPDRAITLMLILR